MKTRPNRIAIAAIGAALATVLSACGGGGSDSSSSAPSAEPKEGGTLTVGIEADWVSLDPIKATAYNSFDALLTIYEPLFNIDENAEPVPVLATGYEVSEDGMTYTVKLQKGVKFQDGTEFNAAAAKVNLDRYRDPANGCTCLGVTKDITSVEAPDAETLVITLKSANAGFVTSVLANNSGIMASPTAIAAGDLNNNPVGTGPFVLESQLQGDSVTVKKWEDYRVEGRPYLDGVTIKVVTDPDARFQSVVSGAVNVADNLPPNKIAEAKSNASLKIAPQGALGSTFIMFNTQDPALADPKARQAACMALDPELINKTLYDGLWNTGLQSPFPNGSPYSPGEIKEYAAYDLDAAKKAVKDLGGLSFSFDIASSPANVTLAQALMSQWEAAGIDVTLNQVDQPTLVQNAFAHEFQSMLYRWRGAADPDGNVGPYFNSATATPDKPSSNYGLVADPKIDELILKGQQTLDKDERKAIYKELSSKLAEITPYCYLWGADWNRVSQTSAYGIPTRADNIMTFTDAYING